MNSPVYKIIIKIDNCSCVNDVNHLKLTKIHDTIYFFTGILSAFIFSWIKEVNSSFESGLEESIKNKQRVLMHGHQGWNVRHGLCHIYMIYMSCL